MTSAIAAGLATTTALSLAEKAMAATPKSGGQFKFGISEASSSDTLDPALTGNLFSINLAHTCRNFLTEIAPDNTVAGELAESWEPNSDGSEWHFKIRKGVEFHNGKTMDVEDVIASLNHHRGDGSSSAAKALLAAITDISTDGKDTVSIALEAPNADFPAVLTDYHLNILPKDGDSIDWQSGVGTGAYILEDYKPGISASYRKNPNFFKEGKGNFDSVEMLALADVNARQTALITGEIHAMDRADLKTLDLISRNPDLEVENVPSWAHLSFPAHMDVDPFTNTDVRLALKYGINREELVEKILFGFGSIGNDNPISTAIEYYADVGQRPYDPDKAKFHLKQAGLDNLSLSLSTSDAAGVGAVDAAVLYREHLAPVGIDLTVVREPSDGYWSDVWLKKPWCAVFWGGRPTADVMFTTAYAEGAPWNDSHMSHDRFNELLVAARGELDQAKRAEMYAEMQSIVTNEGSAIIPMFMNHVFMRRNNVAHGGSLSANWSLDGNRCAERWWFDA